MFFVEIILSRIRIKIWLTGYAEEYDFFLQGAAVHRLVSQASQNMSDCLLCFSSIEKLGDSSRKAVEHF